MFRRIVCGAISQNRGSCGVRGGPLRESSRDDSTSRSTRQFVPFWTNSETVGVALLVVVAVSGVGAGLYLNTRSSRQSCTNYALNCPSCNACGSSAAFVSSTNTCVCTNALTVQTTGGPVSWAAVNRPACDRFCANNAINPPGCDRCPDNQTDVVCPPGTPEDVSWNKLNSVQL